MGSVASWEHWDVGSIPTLAQRVKDPALPQLWLKSQQQLDLIPDPGASSATERPKNKKKKKKTNFSAMFNNLKLLQYNKVVNISI